MTPAEQPKQKTEKSVKKLRWTVTTQVTFCRDAGLFTIATIATQVFQQISLRRCTCVDHCDVFGSENDTALIIDIGVYMQVYTMMSYRRFTHTVIPTESSEWRNLSREHP